MKWRVVGLLLVLAMSGLGVRAQSEGRVRQYMYTQQDFNPAYAGSQGLMNVMVMGRQQWVGFGQGAPQLLFLNVDVPFNYRTAATMTPGLKMQYSHGVGLSACRDAAGYGSRIVAELSYAGRFHLRGKGSLSLGVGFSVMNDRYEATWRAVDGAEGDPAVPSARQSAINFDVSFGLYYNTPRLYFGVSGRNLLGHGLREKLTPTKVKVLDAYGSVREFYVVAGYDARLPRRWALQPSALIRTNLKEHQLTLTLTTSYNDLVWFGVNYSLLESVGGLLSFNVLHGLRIGYQYDYPTSALGRYTSGSHEVVLGYSFSLKREKVTRQYKTVRYL